MRKGNANISDPRKLKRVGAQMDAARNVAERIPLAELARRARAEREQAPAVRAVQTHPLGKWWLTPGAAEK